jgi:curved DNA-binding protein CbpA
MAMVMSIITVKVTALSRKLPVINSLADMQPNHDINRAASVKLLKLVLALHRKELVDIPDAGHTDDILLLLRLANGDAELMAWATGVTGASAKELRVSCVAFVERICFGGDTNPFGVLGLNPWANADAVKEHYRLLIRIFHPDRGQVGNTTAEAYSARINQAYASLKHKVGDGGGNLSERATASYRGQIGIIPRRFLRPVSAQNNGGDSLRWASRLTPAKVLLGMALLAGLIIYLSFPQKMRMPSRTVNVVEKAQSVVLDVDVTSSVDMAMPELQVLPEVVNDQAAELAYISEEKVVPELKAAEVPAQPAMPEKSVKVENTPSLTKHLVNTASVSTVNDKKVPVIAAKPEAKPQAVKTVIAQSSETKLAETKQAAVKPAEAKFIQSKSIETKSIEAKPAKNTEVVQAVAATTPSSVMQATAEAQANKKTNNPVTDSVVAVASEIPVQPRIVTPKSVDVPTDRELHDIVTNFMNHYANGDINAFMQTFDEQVRSDEEGGRSGLYRAYADFFSKTGSRSIVLKDLHWKRQGTVAIAQADYRASIQRNGETQMKINSGTLQIEVVKRGDRALISGFFYQDAQK